MSTYLPTLKQLQYLVALQEHGHFGKAAEATFVTQSTLSAGIRELESLLGLMLVERTRRVVRFTPLGNKIVSKAHRILREAEELAGARPARALRALDPQDAVRAREGGAQAGGVPARKADLLEEVVQVRQVEAGRAPDELEPVRGERGVGAGERRGRGR